MVDANCISRTLKGDCSKEISYGHREICELLILNSNIDINVKTNNNGGTALQWAAYRGHRAICELLISNSNIDISIDSENNEGSTASQLALAMGHNHLAHILSTEARWRMRCAYLSLVYGCPDAAGHIDRFLFDEMMCREVCSYMDIILNSTNEDVSDVEEEEEDNEDGEGFGNDDDDVDSDY